MAQRGNCTSDLVRGIVFFKSYSKATMVEYLCLLSAAHFRALFFLLSNVCPTIMRGEADHIVFQHDES